ncbi:MAG: HAD-IA family hydrolase [bacterium]
MEINKRFKWIFFDLDGTLADSIPWMYRIYKDFLGEFGASDKREEFEELNGFSLTEIVSELKDRHELDGDENVLLGLYRKKIADVYKKYVKPMDGAENILQELNKDYKLMLVTAAERGLALEFIEHHKLNKYFQDYVFGNEIKMAKPSPDIYNAALKKAKICPEAAAAIEDSPNGIKSAGDAGIFVIGLASSHSKEELTRSGASVVITHLSEILPVLESLQ